MGEPLPRQILDSAVDPDAISKQTFDVGRRGYDQDQVAEYLRAVAASLHDAQQREAENRSRVGKAVRRAEKAEQALRERKVAVATPEVVVPQAEPNDVNRKVGDDVASVLDAANTAADQIIAKAKEDAKVEADNMLRSAADRIEQARNECDGLIREAEEARGQILEDMERRRRQARAQVERLRVGRDRLLRSYDVVRRTLDETTGDLKSSLKEAKVRGDTAARSILAEPPRSRQQLEDELADAKLIGRVKISRPDAPAAKPVLRSPALPRPLDPPRPAVSDAPEVASDAPVPRKPEVAPKVRSRIPAQPKAPAAAPVLRATPADTEHDEADFDKLEDHNLAVVQAADDIEEVTALPAPETRNELFELLRIQSSGTPPRKEPGLDAQRDAVISDAAEQLEQRLRQALADEQNDLLASIRSAKKRKKLALTGVVGDIDTHVSRYVVAIHEVAAVIYGAGAALVDAEPAQGGMPAGAVEELLEADLVLPIRARLQLLDDSEVDTIDDHLDPVREFYQGRTTDHVGSAATRLARVLCGAGLHDAQA